MKLLRLAAVSCLLTFCMSFVQASETPSSSLPQLPVAARNELLKHCPSLTENGDVALGDINGDGLEDVAAIVECIEGGSAQNMIVVLSGTTDGRYLLSYQSASWEPHMRRNEYIGIKQRSIQVTSSITSYTEYFGTLYRFALRDGTLVLAGIEYTEGVIGKNDTRHISANFLTNKVVEWRKKKGGRQYSHRVLRDNYRTPLKNFGLDDAVSADALR